ncbi:uncharacterized protein LOC102805769 [Saccoglossus kowalevskii]|uniref:Uncharacterized protein LOC102805769 n=1 Tax=Saccoglossus kowalevskii TaxID=10224 RepID=A0ABM0MDV2_SACKO|nr:PREDICTED: uncharacterized protein LOC102805769 [Saccoglossus kowalevskii]
MREDMMDSSPFHHVPQTPLLLTSFPTQSPVPTVPDVDHESRRFSVVPCQINYTDQRLPHTPKQHYLQTNTGKQTGARVKSISNKLVEQVVPCTPRCYLKTIQANGDLQPSRSQLYSARLNVISSPVIPEINSRQFNLFDGDEIFV